MVEEALEAVPSRGAASGTAGTESELVALAVAFGNAVAGGKKLTAARVPSEWGWQSGARVAKASAEADTVQAQREAFLALADAESISKSAAASCRHAAVAVLRAPLGGAIHGSKRKAINLMISAVRSDPSTLLQSSMAVWVSELTASTHPKAVSRRLRHAIRTTLDEQGSAAAASFKLSLRDVVEGHADASLTEWERHCDKELGALPLSPEEWMSALAAEDDSLSIVTRDKGTGTEEWISKRSPAIDNCSTSPKTLVSWNANSIFKRMRTGQLARLLKDHAPDVLHVSEIKGSPDRAGSRDLRRALFSMGYRQVAWNWCIDAPGNHGSAVFSKCRMRTTFGTKGDEPDHDGRTITSYFADFAVVCEPLR